MTLSSTASLWALPNQPDTSQKKPCASSSGLRSPNTLPLDFVASKGEQQAIKFGAFRTPFEENADRARNQLMKVSPASMRLMSLAEAADTWWINIKLPTVRKPRTAEAYQLYFKHFKSEEIGKLRLSEIHVGHILEYQRTRHIEQKASVSYVNHETNCLSQIMSYCDLWDLIDKHFRALPPKDWTPPKVMSNEEEERFFRVVAGNPDWDVAYWAVSLTNNTSAAGIELRQLQRKDVHLEHDPPKFHIPDGKVKNEFRARVIPLNEVAEKQMRRVIVRAEELAKKQGFTALYPDHYLFPYRISRGVWDVTRPATRWYIRNTFVKMRNAAGLPWLQPHNFRNQIITKLFENGTPDETIISIAGHQSIKMSRFYSRIRLDAKKDALSAISPKKRTVENVG